MKNTLRFIKQGSSKIKFAQAMLSFCVLSLVATTNLFAQSTYELDYTSVGGTNNVNDYTITAALSSSTNFTIDWGNGDQGSDTYTSSLIRVIGGAAIAPIDGGTLGATDGTIFNLTTHGLQLTANNSFSVDALNLYRRGDVNGTEDFTITGYKNNNQTVTDILTWTVTTTNSTEEFTRGEGSWSNNPAWDNIDKLVISWPDPMASPSISAYQEIAVVSISVSDPISSNSAPTVATSAASSITATGATLSGNVTDDGGANVTEYGFVYATSSSPTTSDTKVQVGSGTGSFSEAITGLSAETTYYVRAYAINSEGTSYGSEESFTTSASVPSTPSDQNFDAQTSAYSETGLDIDGIRYITESSGYAYVEDLGVYGISENPSFSGKAILMTNQDSPSSISDAYAEFKSIDNSQNFKIAGFDIETYSNHSSGVFATHYTLIGYDDGAEQVSVTVDMTNSGTYGSGNESIVYNQTHTDGNGATSGDMTFGSAWGNIDQLRFLINTPNPGYYWVGLDNIDFEPAEIVPANNAPTDITLNSTDVNQSDGSNAVVGSLTTTDADGNDTHTYTLVAGTGDDDNGSFNINGSDLRATDASALAAGQYSVRIQTDDGTATYAEAFTITVNDDVAPAFTNSTPSISGTTGSQTTLTVQLDETGTAYYVVVADGDGAPTSAQVKAGQNSGGAGALLSGSLTVSSASQDFTEDITGLSQSTVYDVYVVAEDSEGNLQGSPETLNVETVGPPAFTSTPNTEVDYGQLYSYSMTATEVGDLATTISAPTLPQWLTLSTGGQSEAGQIGNIPEGTAIIGVAGDDEGNIYAANSNGSTIYKIEPDGTTSEWATNLLQRSVYALHVAGNYLYIPRHGSTTESITRIDLDNPEGGEEVFAAFDGGAISLTDKGDWIYAANMNRNEVKRIHKSNKNVETVLIGSDGIPSGSPFGLAIDEADNLYLATWNNRSILKYDGSSLTTVLSGLPQSVSSVKRDESGNFYVSMSGGGIRKYDADWNDYSYVSPGETDNIWSISFTNTGALVYGKYATNEVYRLQTGAILTGTPAKSDVGNHSVVLEATNNVGSVQQSFSIEVQDNTAPVVQTFSPANSATDVALQPTLSLTFDEEITLGNEGTFILNDGTTDVLSYDLSVLEDRDQFSLSGDSKTLNIAISNPLPNNTALSVEMQNGSTGNIIEDAHGNAFGGFLASSNTWTFTTIANQPPVASNADFSGTLKLGESLTGTYDYSDNENDAESGSAYHWYRSDDAEGTNKVFIADAYDLNYTLTEDDLGKYISFEVTPNDGNGLGSAVESSIQGPVYTLPSLAASTVDSIAATQAVISSEVTSDGFNTVTKRGFVYNTTGTPTLTDSVKEVGAGTGTFSQAISGLMPNRTYFVRSFAINNADTAFSSEVNFTTAKKQLTIAGDLTALDKVYDGNTTAQIDVSNLSLSGVEGTDEVTLDSLNLEFIQADVAADLDVTITSATLAGVDAGNYTITVSGAPATTAAITAKELTISGSFTIAAKTYDGTTTATINDNSLSLNGIVETEDVALDQFDLNFPQMDAATGLTVSLSNPVLAGADISNYTVTADGSPTVTADISPRTLALSNFTADDKTYDGNDGVTGIGFDDDRLSGDELEFTYDVAFTDINAATDITVNYTNIAISGGADQNNYSLNATTGNTTADITQQLLTVEADAKSKTFGEADPELTYQLTAGSLVTGDSFSGELSRTGDESTGTYSIGQGTLTAGDNYVINYTGADFVINNKALLVTVDAGLTKVYGAADPTFTYSATGFEAGDDVSILTGSLTREAGEDVGTYAITQNDLSAGGNYTITFTGESLNITPKTLEVTADADQTKVYGEVDPVFTFSATGFEMSDDETVFTGALTRSAGEDAGTYAITVNDLSAGDNYVINYTGSDFEITPKTLAVTVDSGLTKVYGDTDPEFSFSTTGFEFLDDASAFTGALSREVGEDVGSYAITLNDLSAGGNYSIDFSSDSLSITPRLLSVLVDSGQAKTYGETDPDFRYSADGFVYTDDESILSGTLDRTEGENTGTYQILPGNLSAGKNYKVGFNPSDFKIEGKELLVTVSPELSKVYGGSDPELSYDAVGFEAGDDISILSGSLTRESGEDVGRYEVTPGDLSAGENYTITFTSDSLQITPKTLTVQANPEQSKIYGDSDPILTYGYSGFEFDDDQTLFEGELSREEGEDAGLYDILVGNLKAGDNYSIDFTSAEYEVVPAVLSVSADSDQTKIEGEEDPEFSFTAKGFKLNDEISLLTGALSRNEGEAVGPYALTLGTLSAGSNYTIDFTSADFNILLTPPSISSLLPDNDATAVSVSEPLYAIFDKEIVLKDEGLISVLNSASEEIAVSVSVNEATLVITPSSSLQNFEDYSVTIPAGALENLDGIENKGSAWSFRTIMTAPEVTAFTPAANKEKVATDSEITVTYDQEITLGHEDHILMADQFGSQVVIDSIATNGNVLSVYYSGLENLTTYTVTLETGAVKNADQVVNEALSWNFTTIVPLPEMVVLGAPAHNTGSVRFDEPVTFAWNKEAVAETYELEIADNESFESPLLSINNITTISFSSDTLAKPYKVYFWRVRAVNEVGAGSWSEVSTFVTQPDRPEGTFPENEAGDISTAPNLEWDTIHEGVTTRVQFGSDLQLTEVSIDSLVSGVEFQLSGLSANTSYYWRTQTLDTLQAVSTESDWSDIHSFITRPDPEEKERAPVTVMIDFGGTSGSGTPDDGEPTEKTAPEQSDYRMVGLPGADGIRLDNFFVGDYKKKWRAFLETGDDLDFYEEYTPEDDRFKFTPGLGFWVLSTEIITENKTFTAVNTDENDSYGLPVHPGWNIIANPYQTEVLWSFVEDFNNISSTLYSYESQFSESDTLKPFQGYYFYNDPSWDMDSLYVPYTGQEQRSTKTIATENSDLDGSSSLISLNVVFSDSSTSQVELLFGGKQKLQNFKQPHPSLEMARSGAVITDEPEGRLRYKRTLDHDISEDKVYKMEVKSKVGSQTRWSIESKNLSDNTGALIHNKATNQSFIITGDEETVVIMTEPLSTYDLYVGDIWQLMEMKESFIPKEFQLSQNYPNPFNPVTNIRYSVPERADVRLEIFDVLGRKVQTLVDKKQAAGWHVVNWNASSLASGMYLYRLTAGDHVFIKKMTLIK